MHIFCDLLAIEYFWFYLQIWHFGISILTPMAGLVFPNFWSALRFLGFCGHGWCPGLGHEPLEILCVFLLNSCPVIVGRMAWNSFILSSFWAGSWGYANFQDFINDYLFIFLGLFGQIRFLLLNKLRFNFRFLHEILPTLPFLIQNLRNLDQIGLSPFLFGHSPPLIVVLLAKRSQISPVLHLIDDFKRTFDPFSHSKIFLRLSQEIQFP